MFTVDVKQQYNNNNNIGQGPYVLAVVGGGCLDIFPVCHIPSFSLSLGDSLIQTEMLSQRAVKSENNQSTNCHLLKKTVL